MNKKEITLVTGFFDIGRGSIQNKSLQRSNEKYLSYFEHWARMKNRLIVYAESKNVEAVLEIRKKFGLEERTRVIAIDNIFEIESDMYRKMCRIEKNECFKKFRYFENAYSNTAKYAYIMLMKYWIMYDSYVRNLIETQTVAWIDFGYDHGGEVFPNSEEFSFLWGYDFPEVISLFCLKNPDEILGVDSLQLLCDCMMGALICAPINLIETFWFLIKDCMKALLSLDCIDDDQQLLLMAYKRQPELFEIHISDWFIPLKEYGGEHLTSKPKNSEKDDFKMQMGKTLKHIAKLCTGGGKK